MVFSTLHFDGSNAEHIHAVATLLKAGEPVVFPTDTVYGVGTNAFSHHGIDKLYGAKVRESDKGIPILLADIDDLNKVAADFPPLASELAQAHWPGALTIIVPKNPNLPENISPNNGVAVRIPDHKLCRDLIRAAGGALAATSANISGQPPAQTAEAARVQLDGRVAAILDGGTVPVGTPSTIVSLMGDKPVVIRQGSIELNF